MKRTVSCGWLGCVVIAGCSVFAPDPDELMGGSAGGPNACGPDRACAAGWLCIDGACLFEAGSGGGADWPGPDASTTGGSAGTSAGAGGAGTGGGATCAPGFAECDGVSANGCEDLSSDPEHCGSCGHACENQSCVAGKCSACGQTGASCMLDADCCIGWCNGTTCAVKPLGAPCQLAKECGTGVCDGVCVELDDGEACAMAANCASQYCPGSPNGACECRPHGLNCDVGYCCGKCNQKKICIACGELGAACENGECCAGSCVLDKCLAGAGKPCSSNSHCMSKSCTNGSCSCSAPSGMCASSTDCCFGASCQEGLCCLPSGSPTIGPQLCCSKLSVSGKCK